MLYALTKYCKIAGRRWQGKMFPACSSDLVPFCYMMRRVNHFYFFSDKIAARGCDVHVDSMYGPENCHFSFLRSRPFTLYFAYNGQSGLMEGVIHFFLQKSKALKDLLSQVMTARHHILCAAGRVAPSHFQQSALE